MADDRAELEVDEEQQDPVESGASCRHHIDVLVRC